MHDVYNFFTGYKITFLFIISNFYFIHKYLTLIFTNLALFWLIYLNKLVVTQMLLLFLIQLSGSSV